MSTVLPTTGVAGTWDPLIPQNVKDAAIALNKLKSALAAEGLSGVKNVRNIREFNTLAQAATAGLDPNASDGDFKSALNNLRNRYLDAQATTELSVGHKLTGELVGHGNRDLLDPKSPYFNGGLRRRRNPVRRRSKSLKANPDRAADFDALFEVGAAKKILGQ